MSSQTDSGSSKLPINQLLELFNRTKLDKSTNESKPDIPKLENIRLTVVRSLFKGIKHACSMSQPGKGLHKCYYPCMEYTMAWHQFQLFVSFMKHKFAFVKKPRGNQSSPVVVRTKTANFLQNLLEDEHFKKAYELYIEVISSWNSPEVFCMMFRINCCNGDHSEDCYQKWGLLINFLNSKMDSKWLSKD